MSLMTKLKLLQINVAANWGSHGRIAEEIGLEAMAQGWESYIAYGRYANPSKSHIVKIGDLFDHCLMGHSLSCSIAMDWLPVDRQRN